MTKKLTEIAQQLKDRNKKVQLIYAFNGTGKTRLSRLFKELITPKSQEDDGNLIKTRNKILYYNAFTEDLFYWNNDTEFDIEPKLNIQPNSFTNWILKDEGQDQNIIDYFQKYTKSKIMPRFNEDFSQITFSHQSASNERHNNIKISKSEESNLIWCIFYALIELVASELSEKKVNRSTEQFDSLEYIVIDDPVSSLDENHLIEVAVNLAFFINKNKKLPFKFLVLTHNVVFYNVLYNELDLKQGYILKKNEDNTFELEEKRGDSNTSFSYHLYLKSILLQAIRDDNIERFHFTLLRNLYEKTANFLGYKSWTDLLPKDGHTYYKRMITYHCHYTLSHEALIDPTDEEKRILAFLLKELIKNHYTLTGISHDN